VIAFLMLLLLRSVKAATLAMIPNIFPVVLTLGVMGAMGITLNFATVMITSIAIGIAVDDTIHFLVRYRRELRCTGDVNSSIENAILHSGRAMTFTSAAMAAGCGLFILSDFAPSRDFGFLMAFTMITALLSDLFLLPYLIRRWTLRLAPQGDA
jgi:predicted RND superfamily exporter protein